VGLLFNAAAPAWAESQQTLLYIWTRWTQKLNRTRIGLQSKMLQPFRHVAIKVLAAVNSADGRAKLPDDIQHHMHSKGTLASQHTSHRLYA